MEKDNKARTIFLIVFLLFAFILFIFTVRAIIGPGP